MEKIVNELLKEELYYEKLENGLDVLCLNVDLRKNMLF